MKTSNALLRSAFALLTAIIPLVGAVAPAHAQDKKPSVVVMLADNMGYGDLGAYGSGGELRGMPTPRIDKLASEGLRLTHFFVEPGCTPSRPALMLGRYSQRAGRLPRCAGATTGSTQSRSSPPPATLPCLV